MLHRLNDYGVKDISSYTPSMRCYKPLRFYNPYLGDTVYVDCRKCPACLHKYTTELTSRVAEECKQHLWSFFFTLTYDNEHLPVFEKICPTVWRLNRNFPDYEVKDRYILDSQTEGYRYPQKLSTECFGVVCKRDIQLFLKRLRRLIDYEFKDLTYEQKKIRYFIASEYGPTTYRPHYHGALWTDCRRIADNLQRLICKAWSLCDSSRIDVQLINGSAPQYIAKYVNGIANFGKAYTLKSSRPFHLASKNPVIGSFKNNAKEVFDLLINRAIERVEFQNGDIETASYVPVSLSFVSRYFPTCQGFSISPLAYKRALFEKYDCGRFKKVYDKVDKKYIECPLRGYDYLDKSDSFKYADYRYYKMIKHYSSVPITTYRRDSNGNIIGDLTLRLSPDDVIVLVDKLYSALKLYSMGHAYAVQSVVSNSDFDGYELLLPYRNIWCELPLICDAFTYHFKNWNHLGTLFDILSNFGLTYNDVYDYDSFIRSDFVMRMSENELDRRYRSSMIQKIKEADRKKKFNELYNNFNMV